MVGYSIFLVLYLRVELPTKIDCIIFYFVISVSMFINQEILTILFVGGLLMWSHFNFGTVFSGSIMGYVWVCCNDIRSINIVAIMYVIYCIIDMYYDLKRKGYLAYFMFYDYDAMRQEIRKCKNNYYEDILFKMKLSELKNTDLGLYNAYIDLLKRS